MRGRRAPAVSGRMNLAETLTRLLTGADVDFAIGSDGVVTIGPRAVVMTRPRDIKLATPQPRPIDDTPVLVASVKVIAADAADPALALKRSTPSPIDLLLDEDLRRSDSLADAVTRLPGVSATQDGGEARQVSIRGVGSRFTRVRIKRHGGLGHLRRRQCRGGTNRGRAFDYTCSPPTSFDRSVCRRPRRPTSMKALLGPTIDLQTRSAFDGRDKSATLTVDGAYNSRSELASPRITAMASRRLLATGWDCWSQPPIPGAPRSTSARTPVSGKAGTRRSPASARQPPRSAWPTSTRPCIRASLGWRCSASIKGDWG
jgi:iron complex outermembrane receptor protein